MVFFNGKQSYSTSRRMRTDSLSTPSMYEDSHHTGTLLNGSSGQVGTVHTFMVQTRSSPFTHWFLLVLGYCQMKSKNSSTHIHEQVC